MAKLASRTEPIWNLADRRWFGLHTIAAAWRAHLRWRVT